MSAYSNYGSAHNPRTNLHQVVRGDGTPITQPRPLPPATPHQPPLVPSGRVRASGVPWYAPQGLSRAQMAQRAAPLPDDAAPAGAALRERREALALSQRDLAAAAGLSRGLVAEVECGRRRNVLTRQRMDDTLRRLAVPQSETGKARV